MKKIKFTIPIYDWDVVFIKYLSDKDSDDYKKELKKVNVNIEDIKSDIEVFGSTKGSGRCYTNKSLRKCIVIVSKCSSEKQYRNTLRHEVRHLEDDILKYCGVDDMEAAAYLSGYIAEKIY